MTNEALTMLAVGDIALQMPEEAESYFSSVAPVLKSADVVVGQMEVVFTNRGVLTLKEGTAAPCDPIKLRALPYAGFNVITLAGNHIWDSGTPGIEDTIAGLKNFGIAFTGAGLNLKEAKRPAIIERKGTRIGFLNHNCVGPKEAWATSEKPGCAYVHIITHYEPPFGDHPGIPPMIYTFAEPSSLEAMIDDIHKLRPLCDILVVVFHKGLVHTPTTIQTYEKQISYASIDAGCDLVLGHHAHILKGIEQYKGKTIFHGLCNFAMYLRLVQDPSQDGSQRAIMRKHVFGFEPDPEYPTYPFHPDAKYTIVAKCVIDNKKISRVSYLPCWINKNGHPEILSKSDDRSQQVFSYMEKITKEAGLNAKYEWMGDEIEVGI